ncbi:MAG: hypothetical protein ABEJ68_05940 [Halobacteriaceae archaeon]
MSASGLLHRVLRTTRERFDVRSGVLALAVVLAVGVVPDQSLADDVDLLVAFLVTAVALEVVDAARHTDDVNAALVSAAMGVVPALGGAYFLLTRSGGVPGAVLGVVGVVAGAWMVLDGLTASRRGEDRTPTDEGIDVDAEVVAMTHGSLLVEELRDGPQTVPQLADAADLTESRVEDALDRMTTAGIVTETDEGYALDESAMGATGLTRRAVRRLLRPIRALAS